MMAIFGISMSKRLLLVAWTLFTTLGLSECTVRLVTRRAGHVQRVLGNPSHYLVPFDQPGKFPGITPRPGSYRCYDAKLGWTIGAGGADAPLYYADADGVRSSQADHDAGKHGLRAATDIVCVGDSFTHGDEVSFEGSWPHLLAQMTGRKVLNLGVGGYGIDQAALRYEYVGVPEKVVLLGLISGDFERALTPMYSFTRGGLRSKPMFVFDGEVARVVNQPAIAGDDLAREFALGARSPFFRLDHSFDARIFEHSFWDHLYVARMVKSLLVWKAARKPPVYLTPGPDFAFCMAILRYLDSVARSRGATLMVVLLDNSPSMDDRRHNDDPWRVTREGLAAVGIKVIDTTGPIWNQYRADPKSVINPRGVHYTPQANALVASSVAEGLTRLAL